MRSGKMNSRNRGRNERDLQKECEHLTCDLDANRVTWNTVASRNKFFMHNVCKYTVFVKGA